MTIPAPIDIRFDAGDSTTSNRSEEPPAWADQLKPLGDGQGIYALTLRGRTAHISWSAHLARRLRRLLASRYTSSEGVTGSLQQRLHGVQCWPTGSRLETLLLMYELLRAQSPDEYRKRLRLRMPWYLLFVGGDPYPLLTVANRCNGDRDVSYGPFANREQAQRYEQEVLGLFQIRRCAERLHPSPEHPGCIYGEINACLRPCQQAVSVAEYATEAARVSELLSNNGRMAIAMLSIARERACESQDFEQASELHKRLEKLNAAAQSREAVIGNVAQFRGVALTRAANERQLRLWPLWNGVWQDPLTLSFDEEGAPAASIDLILRERLASALSHPVTNARTDDAMALFSRWYYSSARVAGDDGIWFSFRTLNDLNYRGLVREISKLLKRA